MTRLAKFRKRVADLAEYDRLVTDRFESGRQWAAGGGVGKQVVVRCTEAGHKGSAPRLAEVSVTPAGLLFLSRISWRASDQLTLPPWQRRAYERDTNGRIVSDDRLLSDWIEHLASWTAGVPSRGERALAGEPDWWIRDVLNLEDLNHARPELWARCKSHAPEKLDRLTLIDRTR